MPFLYFGFWLPKQQQQPRQRVNWPSSEDIGKLRKEETDLEGVTIVC